MPEPELNPITPSDDIPVLDKEIVEKIAAAARSHDINELRNIFIDWPDYVLALCRSHEKLRAIADMN